jgi:hypothetical protein
MTPAASVTRGTTYVVAVVPKTVIAMMMIAMMTSMYLVVAFNP